MCADAAVCSSRVLMLLCAADIGLSCASKVLSCSWARAWRCKGFNAAQFACNFTQSSAAIVRTQKLLLLLLLLPPPPQPRAQPAATPTLQLT